MRIEHVDWRVSESDGDVGFRWGYAGEDLVAEWEGILSLRASRTGELKELQPVPGASDETVEKTRLGVARAFLRAQQQQHSLHASAVSRRGRAVVCLGASGLGKSTMAKIFCRRPGVELLADDTTALEVLPTGCRVLPSESLLWLMADGSTAKAPTKPARAGREPAVLEWIVSLAFDESITFLDVRELRGSDAVSALLPSVIRFERTAAVWARELDVLGELISKSRVVQATRSRRMTADAVAQALFEFTTPESR